MHLLKFVFNPSRRRRRTLLSHFYCWVEPMSLLMWTFLQFQRRKTQLQFAICVSKAFQKEYKVLTQQILSELWNEESLASLTLRCA